MNDSNQCGSGHELSDWQSTDAMRHVFLVNVTRIKNCIHCGATLREIVHKCGSIDYVSSVAEPRLQSPCSALNHNHPLGYN